eukprot:SAG31_NODE_568_length_14006_cov_4.252119_9_plen_44_part_00
MTDGKAVSDDASDACNKLIQVAAKEIAHRCCLRGVLCEGLQQI